MQNPLLVRFFWANLRSSFFKIFFFKCFYYLLTFSELGGEKIKNKKEVDETQKEIDSLYRKKIGYKKIEEKVYY